MKSGYRVEYSKDENQICIIPYPSIPFLDFDAIVNVYIKLGYKRWLPADERNGFIFEKVDE